MISPKRDLNGFKPSLCRIHPASPRARSRIGSPSLKYSTENGRELNLHLEEPVPLHELERDTQNNETLPKLSLPSA